MDITYELAGIFAVILDSIMGASLIIKSAPVVRIKLFDLSCETAHEVESTCWGVTAEGGVKMDGDWKIEKVKKIIAETQTKDNMLISKLGVRVHFLSFFPKQKTTTFREPCSRSAINPCDE